MFHPVSLHQIREQKNYHLKKHQHHETIVVDNVNFTLAHVPYANINGGGVYEQYCSQPLGSVQDVLA